MTKNINIDFLSFRPRIRLTAFCNRHCSYCFAKDYLSDRESNYEIDLNSMDKILCMCNEEKIGNIGWQGGEPTLHSKINEIIELHKKYEIKATVFTNGLIEKKTIENLTEIVDSVLINCNEPESYKENELANLFENITLMQKLFGHEKVAIGINIYSDKMDTSFILDYALKTGINEVRIDITRPSPSNENIFINFEDINKTFNLAKRTHEILCQNKIKYVHFDCPFPFCAISNENVNYLWNYINSDLGHGQCSTALDISPNSNIATCFCSMQLKDIKIDNFDSLTHAWLFIKYLEDDIKWNMYTKDSCRECLNNKKKLCQGGCLGYKLGNTNIYDKETLLLKRDLFEESREIAHLYILYKNKNFVECYNTSQDLIINKKYQKNNTIEKFYTLSAINLRKKVEYEEKIKLLLEKSFYPSCDALIFASVLKENNFLNLSVYAANLGLELEKNIEQTKYKLHYYLYNVHKEQNENDKAYINLVNYYKLSPMLNKKNNIT